MTFSSLGNRGKQGLVGLLSGLVTGVRYSSMLAALITLSVGDIGLLSIDPLRLFAGLLMATFRDTGGIVSRATGFPEFDMRERGGLCIANDLVDRLKDDLRHSDMSLLPEAVAPTLDIKSCDSHISDQSGAGRWGMAVAKVFDTSVIVPNRFSSVGACDTCLASGH